MSERVKRALQVLPKLNALADEVLNLLERLDFHRIIPIYIDDSSEHHAGFMALSYVSKQEEHLQSLRVLVRAGQHRDAWLIARTMIEGLAQLKWAYNNQPQGPDEWFWYGAVEDWRQLQKNKSEGLADPDTEVLNQQLLDQYGSSYYTSKAAEKAKADNPLPKDPYRRSWNRLDVATIFRQLEGEAIYETVYKEASGWVHWSPRSIHFALTNAGVPAGYTKDDPSRAVQALAAGVLSLLQSLEILNNHFEVGVEGELTSLFQSFDRVLKSIETPDHDSPHTPA